MKRRNLNDFSVLAFFAAVITGLFIFTEDSVNAAKDAVYMCLNVLIPSLMPYFAVSGMIVSMGLAEKCGKVIERITKLLFNVNGACSAAVILGFIGGFPVGAKTAISLYQKGSCSKAEAERLTAFCNNCGPAFVIGVVGASVFGSTKIGIYLYMIQCLSAVIVGIMFRNRKTGEITEVFAIRQTYAGFSSAFTDSVCEAITACIRVSGFVILFSVLIDLAEKVGITSAFARILTLFHISESVGTSIVKGFVELTSGVWSLKSTASLTTASLIIGWSGLSVHAQTLSLISNCGLSARPYFFGKITQALLSAFITVITSGMFQKSIQTALIKSEAETIQMLNTYSNLFASICAASGIAAFFMMIKRDKK